MKTAVFFIIVVCLSTQACREDVIISEKWEFDNDRWLHGDQKKMIISAPDTTEEYKLEIRLRHAADYGYQNLYIKTNTVYPSGKEVTSVTSLELAGADGAWSGDCSNTCTIELPLQKSFKFPEYGDYAWSIGPYMRVDTITGIRSLNVICRKVIK